MTSVIVWIRSPVRRDLRDHDRRRCLGEMSDWREIKVRKRGYISDGRSEEILPLDLSSHSRGEDELEQWIEPRRERVDLLDYSFQLVWSVSPNLAFHVTRVSHPLLHYSSPLFYILEYLRDYLQPGICFFQPFVRPLKSPFHLLNIHPF